VSTFIGKILVIVIMAVSLLFLGVSTVVFSTSKNWQTATRDVQKDLENSKKKLQALEQDAETAKKGLEDATAAFAADSKSLGNRLSTLEEENKRNLEEITKVGDKIVAAQKDARSTLDEVEAKRKQIDGLHLQKRAVDKQAEEFRAHVSDLIDRIRELERALEPAHKNHSEVRKSTGKLSARSRPAERRS
jgi:chromosome segregation ATPase